MIKCPSDGQRVIDITNRDLASHYNLQIRKKEDLDF